MAAYVLYAERPRWWRYLPVVVFFALAFDGQARCCDAARRAGFVGRSAACGGCLASARRSASSAAPALVDAAGRREGAAPGAVPGVRRHHPSTPSSKGARRTCRAITADPLFNALTAYVSYLGDDVLRPALHLCTRTRTGWTRCIRRGWRRACCWRLLYPGRGLLGAEALYPLVAAVVSGNSASGGRRGTSDRRPRHGGSLYSRPSRWSARSWSSTWGCSVRERAAGMGRSGSRPRPGRPCWPAKPRPATGSKSAIKHWPA